MAKRASGLSQQVAADAVGISVRSAQRIDRCELQPEGQQQRRGRHWRTRADPLAEVWDSVLVPMLEKAPQLEPQTLLLHLEQAFPGQEWYRRKRTIQRRVEQWKAQYGPAREVMFLQHHQPGVLSISDFTLLKGEPITVAGQVLEHRLFHFRLPYSGWCHVEVIHGGESFVAQKRCRTPWPSAAGCRRSTAPTASAPASAIATVPTPATTPVATANSAPTWG